MLYARRGGDHLVMPAGTGRWQRIKLTGWGVNQGKIKVGDQEFIEFNH